MGLDINKIDFDPTTPTLTSRIGSFLLGSTGNVVTTTTVGLMEALDVNIAGGINMAYYLEDSASASGDTVQAVALVRQDTLTSSTSTDGDYGTFKSNAKGELYIKDTDTLAQLVLIKSDTAAINTSTASIDTKLSSVADGSADAGNPIKFGGRAYTTATALAATAASNRVNYATDLYRRGLVNSSNNVGWTPRVVTTVSTIAVQLDTTPLAGRQYVLIQNRSLISIYIGSANTVTVSGATGGLEIPARGSYEVPFGAALPIWAIASVAATPVVVVEAG